MSELKLNFADEPSMLQWCQSAAKQVQPGLVIHLQGDLGMGKTTLSRGLIQGLGHKGNVKSPTYTLVEPYELDSLTVYHFDLYRLSDPEELEYMGVRDYFSEQSLCLIEWPEKGVGILPTADLVIELTNWQQGRECTIHAYSDQGERQLQAWQHP